MRRPVARPLDDLLDIEHDARKPFAPQRLPGLTSERVVGFGKGRQVDDEPSLAVAPGYPAGAAVIVLRKDAPGQVVLVPTGLNENDRSAGLQAVVGPVAALAKSSGTPASGTPASGAGVENMSER